MVVTIIQEVDTDLFLWSSSRAALYIFSGFHYYPSKAHDRTLTDNTLDWILGQTNDGWVIDERRYVPFLLNPFHPVIGELYVLLIASVHYLINPGYEM